MLHPASAQQAAPHGHSAANQAAPAGGGTDMKAMMKDMNDKMSSMPMTGNTDVDFSMMTRIHHQRAIDMAQAELRDGKAPQMRKMASQIISAQKKEIAEMDKFLAKEHQGATKKK
ncbi:MAG: DUF305 domain-containing protein [Hydrogenophaga sp.]|nr:DUF305 domain-containing protein [Hydrogenophaga sp.]MBW0183842.1 DUF305 domain-containing protein [Hydrogenophaga sp.]